MRESESRQRQHSQTTWLRHGSGGDVWVRTAEDDTFTLAIDAAVEACQNREFADSLADELNEQFNALIRLIRDWCERTTGVDEAVLGRRASHALRFILILRTAGDAHDFELDDAVAELDEQIYSLFGQRFPVRIQTIPIAVKHGVESFIGDDEAIVLYAVSEGA